MGGGGGDEGGLPMFRTSVVMAVELMTTRPRKECTFVFSDSPRSDGGRATMLTVRTVSCPYCFKAGEGGGGCIGQGKTHVSTRGLHGRKTNTADLPGKQAKNKTTK